MEPLLTFSGVELYYDQVYALRNVSLEVNEGETATRLGLAGITPMAELIMVERDLRLVEITGARYHAAHVSTGAAIAAIRASAAAVAGSTAQRRMLFCSDDRAIHLSGT